LCNIPGAGTFALVLDASSVRENGVMKTRRIPLENGNPKSDVSPIHRMVGAFQVVVRYLFVGGALCSTVGCASIQPWSACPQPAPTTAYEGSIDRDTSAGRDVQRMRARRGSDELQVCERCVTPGPRGRTGPIDGARTPSTIVLARSLVHYHGRWNRLADRAITVNSGIT
jgi:hypothetical protein